MSIYCDVLRENADRSVSYRLQIKNTATVKKATVICLQPEMLNLLVREEIEV